MRKSNAAQKSKTHFEQIPLDVVKRIAQGAASEGGKTGRDGVAAEPVSGRKADADAGHFHAVQFYQDADALCRIVGNFIGEGLEQGAVAVLIVTPDHAARIKSCLSIRAIDVNALKRLGTLVEFDAREMMERVMMDGMPNASAFRRTVGAMLTQVRRGHDHRTVRVYGEMVDLLWKDGLEAAAIRLETLWNTLASTHTFNLLCGYSMGNFYKSAALDEIKGQHTHLVADDGHASVLTNLHPSGAPH
jgi:DcmR-like sensory protein